MALCRGHQSSAVKEPPPPRESTCSPKSPPARWCYSSGWSARAGRLCRHLQPCSAEKPRNASEPDHNGKDKEVGPRFAKAKASSSNGYRPRSTRKTAKASGAEGASRGPVNQNLIHIRSSLQGQKHGYVYVTAHLHIQFHVRIHIYIYVHIHMAILCIHICKIVFKVPVVHKHIDTQLRAHTHTLAAFEPRIWPTCRCFGLRTPGVVCSKSFRFHRSR